MRTFAIRGKGTENWDVRRLRPLAPRVLRVVRNFYIRFMAEGTAYSGYNEVLLTPRCGISISLSTATSYRYYSSCVAQDVLLLSSSENERVRSGRPFACIWRWKPRRCTASLLCACNNADDRNTCIHTPDDPIGGAGSHILIIALPFIGIIGTLSSPRSRARTDFLRDFLPSLFCASGLRY